MKVAKIHGWGYKPLQLNARRAPPREISLTNSGPVLLWSNYPIYFHLRTDVEEVLKGECGKREITFVGWQ